MSIDEALLDEKLSALEAARSWSPRLISRLESMVRSASDGQLFRINPVELAAQRQVAESEAIDLLLHAAKVGLFRIEWHLVCPACVAIVENLSTLREVHGTFRCMTCHAERTVSLDEYIQVSFTVSSAVRRIAHHEPLALPVRDFFFECGFAPGVRTAGGDLWLDLVNRIVRVLEWIEPGERREFEVPVERGALSGTEMVGHAEFLLRVEGEPVSTAQRREIVLLDGRMEPDGAPLAPGRCVLSVENGSAHRAGLVAFQFPEGFKQPDLTFPPFLSGKRILLTQTFRDLFPSETIRGSSGLGVKRLALLFTDLKGSTELYERLGDLRAFALVEQHFERLGRVVKEHGGAIVKTIGDALMASFMEPADAVGAAVAMLRAIDEFNREFGARDIILKIGVHAGASIAVTLNDRLDYFGQTVNIAARVQCLADADEIYVTEAIYRAPGVAARLESLSVTPPSAAHLRGIRQDFQVYRLTLS